MVEDSFLLSTYAKSESIERLINNSTASAFKLSTLIGGAIMLYYCFKIGYFPTDLSISDSFILIALSIIFGMLYGITLLAIKVLFNIIFGFLLFLNIRYFKFKKLLAFSNIIYNKYRVGIDEIFGFIFVLIWLGPILYINMMDILDVFTVLVILFIVIFFYEANLINIREKRVVNGLGLKDRKFIRKKIVLNVSLFVFFIFILISGMKVEGFVNSSMKILSLANNNVSVHVQKPYHQYLAEYGVNSSESSFGSDYVKSRNADVLMQGLGNNVVISFSRFKENGEVEKVRIILPKDKVHIIDN